VTKTRRNSKVRAATQYILYRMSNEAEYYVQESW